MELVGRAEELRVLADLFAGCTRPAGSVAVVSGGVAAGKTRLLTAFSDQASDSGATVTHATCSRMEAGLPFGMVSQLLQSARLSPEGERRVARLLGEGASASTLADSQSPAAARSLARIMQDLHMVLMELAERGPLVVGIDDVQYADPLSLRFLLYFVSRLRSAPVLVVVTELDCLPRADPSFHAELRSHPHCRRIRLGPLSQRAVTDLLTEHLDTVTARRLASTYHEVSGGNPLLVRALLEDYASSGPPVPGQEIVVGDAFGEAVVGCLHRAGAQTVAVARAFAVLGGSGSPAQVGRLLGTAPSAVTQALHGLNVAGLLRAGQFRHQVARAAVLDSMDPAERADLHARAAQTLFEEGAPAADIAEHVVAGGLTGQAWLLPVLRKAAEQALAGDRVDLAVNCLELACRSCPDERLLAEIRALLALVEWRLEPTKALRHLPELTTALREGHLTGHHAVVPFKLLLWQGLLDEARCLLGQLRDLADGGRDSGLDVALRTVRHWVACATPQLLGSAGQAQPERAIDRVLPATVSQEMRAAAVLATVLAQGADDDTIGGAEQVLQSFRVDDITFEPVAQALLALVYADRVDRAAAWCEVLLKETADRRAPAWQALLAAVRAEVALRQGDLPTAELYARSALTQLSSQSWGVAVGLPLACLLLARTEMGKYDEAAEQLSQPVPTVMIETRFGLHYLRARGHYYLATDRPRAALGDFLACGELMRTWRLDLPALVPWRSDAAQACLQIGRRRRARDLVDEQLSRPGTGHSRTRGISLRVLAATREPRARPAMLNEAAELLQASGDQLELARALTDLGHTYHELGDDSRARMAVRRASHLARKCAAEPMVHRAHQLDQVATCPPAPGEVAGAAGGFAMLSDAERRVAALASIGHTNREIAGKLFITVSTVEQHLTSAYRKLNVSGRVELPAALQAGAVNGSRLDDGHWDAAGAVGVSGARGR
ncbi:MAG TPA: AAA family ATPase [Micromonosporaceae bacterium]|nr:AAA family ATPase [Micromonosporaceae bacterium]